MRKTWTAICLLLCAALLTAACKKENKTGLDPNLTYYADLEIQDFGTVTLRLDQSAAPRTAENFVTLAESGFYNGLTFHRLAEGMFLQGGDPNGNGTGGSGTTIPGEFSDNGWDNPLSHTRGAVSMVRGQDPDSASSQFLIILEDSVWMDGQYAVFATVCAGMEQIDEICKNAAPGEDGAIDPARQPVITSITIRTE